MDRLYFTSWLSICIFINEVWTLGSSFCFSQQILGNTDQRKQTTLEEMAHIFQAGHCFKRFTDQPSKVRQAPPQTYVMATAVTHLAQCLGVQEALGLVPSMA